MLDRFWDRGRREAVDFLKQDLVRGRTGGGGPISGVRVGYSSVRRAADDASHRISFLARGILGRERVPELPTDASDPAARFAFAAELHGRDDSYLAAVQDTKHKSFLLYLAMAIGILAIDVATWRSYVSSLLMVIGHMAPIIPALVLALQAALGNWQARHRRLDTFTRFLRLPSEWWPEPSPTMPRSALARSPAALVLLGSAMAAAAITGTAPGAYADTSVPNPTQLFTALPSSDLWEHLLSFVFPGIGPVGGQVTPISNGIADGFSAMIACLMAVAAAMLSFQTLVACGESAHSGELLGRKWHTMWAPIRVCYGFASLAPVMKGYCMLQILVIWIAVASGQMGNAVWTNFVSGLNGASIVNPNLPETVGFVRDTLKIEVCSAAQEQVDASYNIHATPWVSTSTQGYIAESTGQAWNWLTGWWSNNASTVAPWHVHHRTWSYGTCGSMSGDYTDDATGELGTLTTTQLGAVDSLRQTLHGIAELIVATTQSGTTGADPTTLNGLFAQVVQAKSAFDSQMQTATSAFATSSKTDNVGLQAFQSASTQAGWLSAGAYYMTIARVNSSQVDAARNLPVVDMSSFDKNRSSDGPLIDSLFGTDGAFTTFDSWWDSNVSSANAGGLSVGAAAAGTMRTGGIYAGLKDMGSTDSWLQKTIMNQVLLDPSSFDGMQQMVNLGDYIVGVGETIVGGPAILKTVAKIFPAGRIAGAVSSVEEKLTGDGGVGSLLSGPMSFVAVFVGALGMTLVGAGLYDSMILPMMPFMHFTFAVMGILVLVCEGVIAAPLWAFAHCRMDGDELFAGSQRAGYQILFNLLFRIPLTLLGLFFSLLVFNAMVWLLSATLYPAMAAATANSLFGVLGTVVFVVLISGINYGIANRAFSMVTQAPDRVSRWFGAGGDGHGDEGHHVSGAVGIATRHASGGAQALQGAVQGAAVGGSAAADGTQNKANGKMEVQEARSIRSSAGTNPRTRIDTQADRPPPPEGEEASSPQGRGT